MADKSPKNDGDKSDGNSRNNAAGAALQQAGAQVQPAVQPQVQPDASQVSAMAANSAIVAALNDDTGEDEPGVAAVGTTGVAANRQAKAQAGQSAQNTQNGKNPQTAGSADGPQAQASGADQNQPQQDAVQPAKPWQAKAQNSGADGTGDATADFSQVNGTGSNDMKQAAAPTPQVVAASDTSVSKLADTGNSNMPVFAGTAPQTQGSTAPAISQNVQVSTSGANLPALAVEIAARSQSGAKQFDIRLDPPELGRVEIRLSIDATGKASAHLSADQPQTLDLLQRDAPTLTRALRDAGLNVSQNGLNFSLRQQPGDAGAGSNQSRGGNGRSFTLTATSNIDPTSAGATYRAPADGRLDIRV